MERAARVFRKSKQSGHLLSDQEALRAVWASAVGKAIASHTSRLRLARTTLVAEVEDATWQRQLHSLSPQILERLHKLMPDIRLTWLEFRVGVPRREAQRAASASGAGAPEATRTAACADEADRIEDPVLKKVYQISRRKASA